MSTDARTILALDPANRTGWAYLTADGRRLYGAWDLRQPWDDHPGDRLRRLHDGLAEFLGRYPAELIACEDAHYGTKNHEIAALHAELRGVVKLVAREHNAGYVAFKPSTIKKFATGYGLAKKPQMVAACKRLLCVDVDDDNIADALFILELARQSRPAPATKPKGRRSQKRGPQGRLFK